MDLNEGFFKLNGGSGYILKPEYLRNGKKNFTKLFTGKKSLWDWKYLTPQYTF